MSCGIVVVKQGCINVINVGVPEQNIYRLQQANTSRYIVEVKNIGPTGAKGDGGNTWQWGNVVVEDPIDIVYSPLFTNYLAPIIFIDGVAFKWAKLGIVQNKRDLPGEEGQTPYLDFSGYALGEGVITGEIDFQFIITS